MEYKYDIYLAGPFFNAAQKEVMASAKRMLIDAGFRVCDPQELSPVLVDLPPEERKQHARNIFLNNIRAMRESFALVACIDDRDTGTAFELGFCFEHYMNGDHGPMVTFSGHGYGCNVMLAEAADFHWGSIPDMVAGLTATKHCFDHGVTATAHYLDQWQRQSAEVRAEAVE